MKEQKTKKGRKKGERQKVKKKKREEGWMGTIPARAKNIIRVQHRCWVKMYRKKRGHHQQLARKNKRIYRRGEEYDRWQDCLYPSIYHHPPPPCLSSTLLLPFLYEIFYFDIFCLVIIDDVIQPFSIGLLYVNRHGNCISPSYVYHIGLVLNSIGTWNWCIVDIKLLVHYLYISSSFIIHKRRESIK